MNAMSMTTPAQLERLGEHLRKLRVTDRRNGATNVRRNGASFMRLNSTPEGGEGLGYFAAFTGVDLVGPAGVLGARYEAPSSTMQ